MKQIIKLKATIMATLVSAIIISGCESGLFSTVDTYIPDVEITSFENFDDTTLIHGRIIDIGSAYVKYSGFFFNDTGNPSSYENQIFFENSSTTFSATTIGLEPGKTYFLKAFSVFGFGFSESKEVAYTVPALMPPDVPCALYDNVIVENNSYYNISYIYAWSNAGQGPYEIEVSCYHSAGPRIFLSFHGKPQNGIFNTCSSESFNNHHRNVHVTVKRAYSTYYVQSGGKVYVENNNNDTLIVSFCSLIYRISSDMELKGKIIVK